MAVLPTRFNTLRLRALSGHILIVDEAHEFDPYMEAQLRRLLQFHALLGGSAIVMTATLPLGMRAGYAKAFQRGLGVRRPRDVMGDAYPMLSRRRARGWQRATATGSRGPPGPRCASINGRRRRPPTIADWRRTRGGLRVDTEFCKWRH